jgi:hypothetical protein
MAEGVIGKVLGIFQDTDVNDSSDSGTRDELWYWALLKTLKADMKAEKLYPPGTVYWINAAKSTFVDPGQKENKNTNTTPLNICEVDDVEITFSEIVFSTSMFTDQ